MLKVVSNPSASSNLQVNSKGVNWTELPYPWGCACVFLCFVCYHYFLAGELLLSRSLLSGTCCSQFVVCVSVLPSWNGWNIWLQGDLTCALNRGSNLWGFFPSQHHKLFSLHIFWHQLLERETWDQFLEENGKTHDFILRSGRRW